MYTVASPDPDPDHDPYLGMEVNCLTLISAILH